MKGLRIFLITLAIILLIVIIYAFYILNISTIYDGVEINGISVGRLNRDEALTYIYSKKEQEIRNRTLLLSYKDYKHMLKYGDIGVTYDYYKAVDKAYHVGRKGSLFNRLREIYMAKVDGYSIEMTIKYDKEMLYRVVSRISKDLNQESKNADIKYINGKFQITPEVIGREVNDGILKERIIDAVLNKSDVDIPVEESIPHITEEKLREIKDALGSFTTSYSGSSQGRVHNIVLSSQAINGVVLLPGEVFSFNEITGIRNREAGYREAKIILNGEYVDAIGGGVCQVSTTLYNAALLSDLEIVERYPHSIPSSYVAKGRDATVVDGYLDLKFRNNTDSPVYIHAVAANSNLNITIFSNKLNKNRTVRIESVITEKIAPETEISIDSSLNSGEKIIVQKGRYGYKVETYRIVYENGRVIKRETISNDYYKPKKQIVKMGPLVEEIEE